MPDLQERAAEIEASDQPMVDERFQLARDALRERVLDLALSQFKWLWDNMLKYALSMSGVRSSFMASEIEKLIECHPPARAAFAAKRDALLERAQRAGRMSQRDAYRDWIELSERLGDTDVVLEWYDGIKGNIRYQEVLDGMSRDIEELLAKNERWADLGRLIPDPISRLQRQLDLFAARNTLVKSDRSERDRERQLERDARRLRTYAAHYYAGMLATGNDTKAGALVEFAIAHDDTPEMRCWLVELAIACGCPSERDAGLLDEAEAMGRDVTDVRKRLRRTLRDGPAA
ncbi:MAG: hypothetical protein AAGD00_00295 [Planctomycetota bacterium]